MHHRCICDRLEITPFCSSLGPRDTHISPLGYYVAHRDGAQYKPTGQLVMLLISVDLVFKPEYVRTCVIR